MPDVPTRLTEPGAAALLGAVTGHVTAAQNARKAQSRRFRQVRRGNLDDRRACGVPASLDERDGRPIVWWADEYSGPHATVEFPQGRGWIGHVRVETTAAENSDGVEREWHYRTHTGPEARNGPWETWYPVTVFEGPV